MRVSQTVVPRGVHIPDEEQNDDGRKTKGELPHVLVKRVSSLHRESDGAVIGWGPAHGAVADEVEEVGRGETDEKNEGDCKRRIGEFDKLAFPRRVVLTKLGTDTAKHDIGTLRESISEPEQTR